MEGLIEIRDLSFGYTKERRLFNGINLTISGGERIGIIGHNGAGKSTLLHLIMGLLKPTSGEIRIFGKARKDEKDFLEVRQRIGLLFQDSDDQLFCPTVEEDIAFGPLNLGKSQQEAMAIVKETCDRLGLFGFEKRITHRLSGGEKRLVALATIMAMDPECLLLDEPTSSLDTKSRRQLINLLKGLGHTMIIVSHDFNLILDVCKRCVVISDGKIAADGISHEILLNPSLLEDNNLEPLLSLHRLLSEYPNANNISEEKRWTI